MCPITGKTKQLKKKKTKRTKKKERKRQKKAEQYSVPLNYV